MSGEDAESASWQPARLIPTSGINGAEEAEKRATSALLAVMTSVKEFGAAILRPLGATAGPVEAFIEVPFKLGETTVCPDGLISTTRGNKTWTVLVEVKTGPMQLHREQVEHYLDVARERGFAGLLTISNQVAPAPGVHPVEVDKRKLKKASLFHLSWAEILTIAVQQRVHRGVSDPDQAWILGELIRYLEHPKSGASDFNDMGAEWVSVREAVAMGTLRPSDKGVADVVSRWDQLLRFAAMRLGRELGADVELVLSRKELGDHALRMAEHTAALVEQHSLIGSLRIPGAVAPLLVTADLRAGRVTVSADVQAPRAGRPQTRVNWLVRQLKDAPDGLRIDAWAANSRVSTSDLLRAVRVDPNALIDDPKKDLRTFRIAAVSSIGAKRTAGRGGFIDSVLTAIDGFYDAVLQQVRPWSEKAPQLPQGTQSAAEQAGIDLRPPPTDIGDEGVDSDDIVPPDEVEGDAPGADVVVGAETGNGTGDDAEIVQWDRAQERLDRERQHSSPPDEPTTTAVH
jgi:hypothetical protein